MTGLRVFTQEPIGLAYLARGQGPDHQAAFRRFVESYRRVRSGAGHQLYVIFKGFESAEDLRAGHAVFAGVDHTAIETDDASFDIGAYAQALALMQERFVCFLNTHSEIIADRWLGKLAVNLARPGIELVGATGSFESLRDQGPHFPMFPNVHVRSNAFMIRRARLETIWSSLRVRTKLDAFLSESGPASLTRRILGMGFNVLLVGADGRGYKPQEWPTSGIFRQGFQPNLLVHDNVTRRFEMDDYLEKKRSAKRAWGIMGGQERGPLAPGELSLYGEPE